MSNNDFYYRFFLICNDLANQMMGHVYQNFAELKVQESNGRYGNAQMTRYFDIADECGNWIEGIPYNTYVIGFKRIKGKHSPYQEKIGRKGEVRISFNGHIK